MTASPPLTANVYDCPHLDGFVKVHMSVVLLTEVLVAHGLGLERPHPTLQVAIDPRTGARVGFLGTRSHHTTLLGAQITQDKQATRRLLDLASIPVPRGRSIRLEDRDEVAAYTRQLGWPVVAKPRHGQGGEGVTTGISSSDELADVVGSLERAGHERFLLEEHVTGRDYRFFVEGDRVISVILREPANVVGDGRSTVAQLVAAKNESRQPNPYLRDLPIHDGAAARRLLVQQGLTMGSIPGDGQRVPLASAANASQGGDTTEVLADTDPELLATAVRAVHAIPGLRAAGIDLLAGDHRLPPGEQSIAICEVNAAPAIGLHSFPLYGPSRPVVTALVEGALESGGGQLGPAADLVDVRIEVAGRVRALGYRRWCRRRLADLGLEGGVTRGRDRAGDTDELQVAGPPGSVAAFISHAFRGPRITDVRHLSVTAVPQDGRRGVA